MTHACPAGCGRMISAEKFACSKDWYRLPVVLRAAVWAGYRAGPGGEQHQAAMEDAIDWYHATKDSA